MQPSSTFTASNPDAYEQLMGRWSRRLAQPFMNFACVSDGEHILDVGCGTGSLTWALADRVKGGRIEALDYAAVYVEHASTRHADPRVAFRVGDACALPFTDGSFDRTLSLLMLHFVPQAELAVREMRRVTRPGGEVAAAVWDARGGYVANRMFYDTAAALDPRASERRARNYTRPMTRPGELAEAWRNAGLADICQDTLTIRMEFAGFDDYWSPYEGGDGPAADYLKVLTGEELAKLRDAVRLAFLDGEPDGPRSYAATAWVVKGSVPMP